jgi:hypothetical protein
MNAVTGARIWDGIEIIDHTTDNYLVTYTMIPSASVTMFKPEISASLMINHILLEIISRMYQEFTA